MRKSPTGGIGAVLLAAVLVADRRRTYHRPDQHRKEMGAAVAVVVVAAAAVIGVEAVTVDPSFPASTHHTIHRQTPSIHRRPPWSCTHLFLISIILDPQATARKKERNLKFAASSSSEKPNRPLRLRFDTVSLLFDIT